MACWIDQAFVKKVLAYAIDTVIDTVKKLKDIYDVVERFFRDPEAAIEPRSRASPQRSTPRRQGKRGRSRSRRGRRRGGPSQSQSPGIAIQRSPDRGATQRTTTTRADVNENVDRELSKQFGALDVRTMLWDTVVNLFWPPATIRAIGHEFSELWNTDWKNAVDSLFAPRSIVEDFSGFWHDVWTNFLTLLEFPLALWRRLNNVLMLLMGYVTILLILAGAILGSLAGGVGRSQARCWVPRWRGRFGELLFVSFVMAESRDGAQGVPRPLHRPADGEAEAARLRPDRRQHHRYRHRDRPRDPLHIAWGAGEGHRRAHQGRPIEAACRPAEAAGIRTGRWSGDPRGNQRQIPRNRNRYRNRSPSRRRRSRSPSHQRRSHSPSHQRRNRSPSHQRRSHSRSHQRRNHSRSHQRRNHSRSHQRRNRSPSHQRRNHSRKRRRRSRSRNAQRRSRSQSVRKRRSRSQRRSPVRRSRSSR